MKKEDLLAQGLTEEQAKYVMGEYGKTVTTHNKAIEALKESETALQAQIAENNTKLAELGEQEGNSDALNQKIKELQESNQALTDELAATTKTNAIHNALRDAGANDLDYLAYKLGEVEVDDKGVIKDLENKIKDLQTNHPTFFEVTDPADPNPNGPEGFEQIPNQLKDGNAADPDLTEQFTSAFTADIPAPQTTN